MEIIGLKMTSVDYRDKILNTNLLDIIKNLGLILFIELPLFLSVDLSKINIILDNTINALKVFSLLFLIVIWFRKAIRSSQSKSLILFLILTGWTGITTLINKGDLIYYLITWGGFLGVALLINIYIETPVRLIYTLDFILSTLAVLNFITVIFFPDGLWQQGLEGYWLLGHRNSFGPPLIASLAIRLTNDIYRHNKVRLLTFGLYGIALTSTLITWSATSIVAILLSGLALILIKTSLLNNKQDVFLGYAAYQIMNVLIVYKNIQYSFSSIINSLLNRSASLTGRVQLWEIVKAKISQSPLTGYGVHRPIDNGLTIYNAAYVHSHNGELDVIYNDGLIGYIVYISLFLVALLQSGRYIKYDYVRALVLFLFIMLIYSITNIFISSYAVLLLMLSANAEQLVLKRNL